MDGHRWRIALHDGRGERPASATSATPVDDPTLIVTGDADELVPFDTGPARAFASAPGPITLVRLHGGNHVGFIGIEIPGADNADEAVGCTAVENAGTGGATTVVDDVNE